VGDASGVRDIPEVATRIWLAGNADLGRV
jgi:hypothetical protein